ncbi:MAG: transposase, partial [Alphaproteobacteria bacterium]|nr:transposase [Alphaproteobacteria bacterium]
MRRILDGIKKVVSARSAPHARTRPDPERVTAANATGRPPALPGTACAPATNHTSARYRRLVTRVRGMLRTRINATLNRLVVVDKPAVLRIERLDFHSPHLSRRMNRLVTNCGRRFQDETRRSRRALWHPRRSDAFALQSRQCSKCGYIDRANRRSQSEFVCRSCGHRKHADVNAACTVKGRRSAGLGDRVLTKGAILAKLIGQFCERFPQPQGAAADPRFANQHFAGWAAAARNALITQD